MKKLGPNDLNQLRFQMALFLKSNFSGIGDSFEVLKDENESIFMLTSFLLRIAKSNDSDHD